MKEKSLDQIEKDYTLELERAVKEIIKEKAKKVLLQFPDGLKPYSTLIKDKLDVLLKYKKQSCEIFIWLDSCFGACDVPLEVERLGVDMIIQFGHSNWNFENKKGIKILS
jgi:2-(3-amino-3-carboxypropyl)histidine synthase